MQKQDFWQNMKEWFNFINPLREKIEYVISNKKMRLLICGCAAGLVLLFLLLVISLGMNHNQDERSRDSEILNSQLLAPHAIKPEDLFLPAEPDFIPEVILDREPRNLWTEEDAKQFWSDPLNGKTDVWKNRIFDAVDDIMENIP
jgi:hypothetical protein